MPRLDLSANFPLAQNTYVPTHLHNHNNNNNNNNNTQQHILSLTKANNNTTMSDWPIEHLSILDSVRAILPERTVFSWANDFTMAKLPTVVRALRADEQRVCLLVGTAAKEFLNHVQNNQSQDGVVYVLFAHDFPNFLSGVAHTMNTEITRRKIHEFFCPI